MSPSTLSYFTVSRVTPPANGNTGSPLFASYQAIISGAQLVCTTQHQKLRLLGKGGQGMVYFSERKGSDNFKLPVALKVFTPAPYRDDDHYREEMGRIAAVASRVALIQHDNLVNIQNFVEQDGIRLMEMECVNGFDLRKLLTWEMLDATRAQVTAERWEYVDRVIISAGRARPRLKPGMAIQVLRGCLAGLGALHREAIIHGDVKPSNIMLKRTGSVKIIDIGSATALGGASTRPMWSPVYSAPEILQGAPNSCEADLASLGYVLVEMLAGQSPFEGIGTYNELLEAKNRLEQQLPRLLPEEVSCNELLLYLCRRLVAADPARRFASAEAADLERQGAADFHHQLVKNDLSSAYETDFRTWLEPLHDGPESIQV
jgi:serine/threonine-protein kinase